MAEDPSQAPMGADAAQEGQAEGLDLPWGGHTPSIRFEVAGDGVVVDRETGLMWLKDADVFKSRVPWQFAREYIEEMNSGRRPNYGFTDWRLPKIKELASLFDPERYYPALPAGHPFENVQTGDYYWSSSGGFNIVGYAWVADLAAGNIKYDYISYCNFQHFWPVRSTERLKSEELMARLNVNIVPSDGGLTREDLACDVKVGGDPPEVPVGLTATPVSPSDVVLSWNIMGESLDIAWYNVYDGKKFLKSVPETFASFEGLSGNTTRCFSVSSYDSSGQESEKSQQVCATTWMKPASRTVWSEGANSYGQVGDGSKDDRPNLVVSSGLSDVVKVDAGVEHAVAVKSDGTVWTWGRNLRGQLGIGTVEDSQVPVRVEGLSGVVDVAAGWYHTLALGSDGTLWAWGRNYYGQLGDGSQVDRLRPVKVKGIADVKKIAAGWYHSIAVRSDGTVWTWGWNFKGQLGYGEPEDRYTPVKVIGLSDIVDIDGGMYHTLALESGGKVWAWGWNEFGQLGVGNTLDTPFPVQVKGIEGVVDVAAGMHFSVALLSDGTVWAWGRNDYGQLGRRSSSQSKLPVQVKGLEGVRRVSAGAHHAVALINDGTVWAWGWDYAKRQENAPPRRISGIKGIMDIAAGLHFTTVIKD